MPVIAGGDANAAAQNAIAATSPATSLVAITPSDSVNISPPPRALYISGAGQIALVGRDDTPNTGVIIPVAAGQIIPIICRRVLATGTTATGIVGLY